MVLKGRKRTLKKTRRVPPAAAIIGQNLKRHRSAWGFFRDRRTDLYGPLTAPPKS